MTVVGSGRFHGFLTGFLSLSREEDDVRAVGSFGIVTVVRIRGAGSFGIKKWADVLDEELGC